MNEKIENVLNLALNASPEELNKSQELGDGFDDQTDSWDLIVRYNGSLDRVRAVPEVSVKELEGGYAILNVPSDMVEYIANLDEIIFVEKPKRLEFAVLNGKRESCINQLQEQFDGLGLFGEGVIVGVVDSGIDYTNDAFINEDGSTRILKLWDQVTNRVYSEDDINQALKSDNPYTIVNSRDISGHGTHVAGIAAGNFARDKQSNLGIATRSRLIIVKMATAAENSFPRTTELMEAVDFVIRQAEEYGMPLALNISFGNNYGSHDGTSLLSTYLNSMADGRQNVIVVGSGNEGDSGSHTGGVVNNVANIEFQVSLSQPSFSVQLWKNYADEFEIKLIAPDDSQVIIVPEDNSAKKYVLQDTQILVYYGTPKPYSRYQEIYMDFIPNDRYVNDGIWLVQLTPIRIVEGKYDMWLPSASVLNESTRFLRQTPDITLTEPSAAAKVITVGAYDSATDKLATFSGRGFTRETNQVKPDIVAPGVEIISAAAGGGTTAKSGTSMATPFVTGSAALMMEWGIVRGEDPYLYGEKVKAYLIKGARHLPEFETWPNPQAGDCVKLVLG